MEEEKAEEKHFSSFSLNLQFQFDLISLQTDYSKLTEWFLPLIKFAPFDAAAAAVE